MKRIFIFALIAMTAVVYSQPRKKTAWRDLEKAVQDSIQKTDTTYVVSTIADTLPDVLPQVTQHKDTVQLKLATSDSFGYVVNLKQLSSTNTAGGGLFVLRPAAEYDISEGVIGYPSGGSGEWIRQQYIETGVINIEWAGGVGDGSTDNVTAYSRARSAALNNSARGGRIYFPEGDYDFATALDCESPFQGSNDAFFEVFGDGIGKTKITITANGENGLDVNPSGTGNSFNVHIHDLEIVGPGAPGVSTAKGINYQRNLLGVIERVRITGFKYGIYLDYVNAVEITNCQIRENEWGIYTNLAANEWSANQCYITNNDSCGIYVGAGIAPKIIGGAMGSQPIHVELGSSARLSMFSVNCESYDSTGFILNTSSSLSLNGLMQINNGDTPFWATVNANANLEINGMRVSNISNHRILAKSAGVNIVNNTTQDFMVNDTTNTSHYLSGTFRSVPDNGDLAIADSTERGEMVYAYRRTASPKMDNLVAKMRLNDTTYHEFYMFDGADQRVALNASSGSIARAERLIHSGFRWPFNTAGASQDCTQVVVDLSSKLPADNVYSATATIEQSQGRNATAMLKSQSSNVYTFVVWQHPPDTSIASFSGYLNIKLKIQGDPDAY